MKQFTYTIKDELGVHARPAGLLVKLAKKYASKVTIEKDGKTCDMRKLMAVMGLGIKQGETITVTVEGEDETVAAEEIAAFLNENVSMTAVFLIQTGRFVPTVLLFPTTWMDSSNYFRRFETVPKSQTK